MLHVVEEPIIVRAPAKINLHLAVGDLRDDGYHELTTVYQALSLYDEVAIRKADSLSISVQGEGSSDVPLGSTNLVWRAAELMAAHAGRANKGARVHIAIKKGIPVAGGLAGGSADAAATLVALNELWRVDASRADLVQMAAELGSDVPFSLSGGTAMGVGRGEQLLPVLSRNSYHWVLAFAKGGLSTPAVYKELDRLRESGAPKRLGSADDLMHALTVGDPEVLAPLLGNDLQIASVSLMPTLRRTLRAGSDAGALAAIVSGSGPTCAFLCASEEDAVNVSVEVSATGVCRTVRTARGPVHGARVVQGDPPPPSSHRIDDGQGLSPAEGGA
ncbi:4-(cytidine 5'-diphospho)-2-C-methyl-D-erythritol kinase [Hoyosella rhizosphaerae]|uniref:4-diphosphocytidyl-2-C-methyl-D-erythritol kinase n=1 Tax=Hoyosella rhizosphaerae TaxID=1755582 RepID=A0A916UDC5_9ACTN|nr:4-(cytidine 5'-diphospho)-2-C-methyl-D-erythritol kinase [Hoyosella rhizosphaerae]MBN4925737.1 4-(cytidine 5'-diphospho)-2-C-methyl-D-erythritol kinase [Hoyosella rhizosphaerae]GGC68343.1 4-diphosphocytidyl-2-C-methyl-D-erythritol kinase [Hoyosella rhizosphaerae]